MPTKPIDKTRSVCALGGYQTLLAIDGAVPVSYSGPGCLSNLGFPGSSAYGGPLMGPLGPQGTLCDGPKNGLTGIEGEENLRRLIETSRKEVEGEFYVVVSGCTPTLVGDDISEVVGSFSGHDKPVLYAETSGCLGNHIRGHEKVIQAIVSNLVPNPEKINPRQVNIWGIVPYYDPFWLGSIQTIEALLTEIGLEPNFIYGKNRGLASIRKISEASANIVLSPWWDLEVAQSLKDRFGTPLFHFPVFPVGPTQTGRFLREITNFAHLEIENTERVIRQHEQDYQSYLNRTINEFGDEGYFPKYFTTVANSTYALGVSSFLANDLGMIPETQYVTDGVPELRNSELAELFQNIRPGVEGKVIFSEDSNFIHKKIRNTDFIDRPFILGSTWEKPVAEEVGGYFLSISTPTNDRLILNRSYFGYDGGLNLIEDFYTSVQSAYQARNA